MAGRVQHLDAQPAQGQAVAVCQQSVERRLPGGRGQVEDGAEDALHLADVLAHGDRGARALAQVRGRAEVVGMRMGFQDPAQAQALGLRGGQHGIGRAGVGLAAGMVVVEHGVDGGGLARVRIPDQVGHGMGGFVEEWRDAQRRGHESTPLSMAPVQPAGNYIRIC